MTEFGGYNAFGTKEEFYEALRDNRDRPAGRAKAAIAEEILDAAEAFGDRAVVVSALVELMAAYHGSGESVKYPVAFARLMRLWDEAPEDFDGWETHRFFWFFKWVASGLIRTPDVPLASIKGWIDEMQRRYRIAGHPSQPVYAEKFALARHIGEGEDLAYELWATRGRTQLSDCAACEARSRARFLIDRGADEAALTEMEATFTGRSTCDEEPHTSQAAALLPLLRLGRLDEARTAHLIGYRAVRGKDAELGTVGRHLEFCAWTGNEARGLELLSQNRGLFGFSGDPLSRLEFLIGAETLLVRLLATGHGDVPCAGPLGREWTVAALRETVATEADALAVRFDARNGTARISADRIRRVSAPLLLAEPLNLGVRTTALQGQGSGTDEAFHAFSAATAVVSPSAQALTPIPDDFAELVAEARRLDRTSHPGNLRLWNIIAERVAEQAGPAGGAAAVDTAGAVSVDDLLRGELAAHRGFRTSRAEDWEATRDCFVEASQWYAKAGLPVRMLSADARAIWSEVMAKLNGDLVAAASEAWPRLDELLTRRSALMASEQGDEDAKSHLLVLGHCRLLIARNVVLRSSDHPDRDQWIETFRSEGDALLADAAALGVPLRTSLVHEVRSEHAGSIGDTAAAEREARTAIRLLDELGWSWRLHRPRMLLALALGGQGKHADAVTLLHTALAEAHPATEPAELTPLHRLLGDMARESGDLATAVRAYSEAAVRLDRAGEASAAVETRWRMATAMMQQGSVADAVAVLETLTDVVLDGPDDGPDGPDSPASSDADAGSPSRNEQLLTQVRLDLAHGLLRLGEPREAAVEYLRIADTVSGWTDQRRLTYAAACAARALAFAGSWDSAKAALDRALTSNETAPAIAELNDVLRDMARAAINDRGKDAADQALEYVELAERLRNENPEIALDQFISVDVDVAEGAHARGLALYAADRDEEALASFEEAAAVYQRTGLNPRGRFEAIRMAAVVEMNALDRTPAAMSRLDAASAEADRAGLSDAASVLRQLRRSSTR